MGQDIQPPLHEHLRIDKLVGVAERELAVLARLIDDGGAESGLSLARVPNPLSTHSLI